MFDLCLQSLHISCPHIKNVLIIKIKAVLKDFFDFMMS